MELLILELIWWAILFLFFWGLRDARTRMQNEVESMALINEGLQTSKRKPRLRLPPASVREPIGTYLDKPIYRYVELDGRNWQFDRVCPPELSESVDLDELYLAPGLVYQECRPGTAAPLPARR